MNAAASVLLIDDDPAVGKILGALLRQDGLEHAHVESAAEALRLLESRAFDLVISDVRIPGMDGIELLGRIAQRWPELPVVMLTAHGTVQLAVEAMKRGAADFLQKPFDREEILYVVHKALKLSEAARSAAPIAARAPAPPSGRSRAMAELSALVARVAPTNATVLVRGESGTGKELVARAIHDQSPRARGPFVKVHCGALPDNLIESELFGYEKGAFTGACARKPGRVELAEDGTLFLDEIGEISPALQQKLLRLLQEREYDPLGGTKTVKADVRFVAATNRDLEAMVQSGAFREDLFYRLYVVAIRLPPLRERPEDIEPLAREFCAAVARANGKPAPTLDASALALLRAQAWRGNVRELENFIERLVILAGTPRLGAAEVERELARQPVLGSPSAPAPAPLAAPETLLDAHRQAAERQALVTALRQANDNKTVAARILGVSRRTLYAKLHEHGLM